MEHWRRSGPPPGAAGRLVRFFLVALLLIYQRVAIPLSLKKNTPRPPGGAAPPASGTFPATGDRGACCDAAVMVGHVDGWGVGGAWRKAGQEVASDLSDLGFRVTFNPRATTSDVLRALANRNLKILVVFGHGDADKNTPTIYMKGDPNGTEPYFTPDAAKRQIQAAHGGAHPCLQKVIFESCYVGSPIKRPMWQAALGLTGGALVAPTGEANPFLSYWHYFFKRDYGVRPDPGCGQ